MSLTREQMVDIIEQAIFETDTGLDAALLACARIQAATRAATRAAQQRTLGVEVRATHPYGFRSGEWAVVTGVQWANDRPCYTVRFPDGATDSWVISDPSDPYEFRAAVIEKRSGAES